MYATDGDEGQAPLKLLLYGLSRLYGSFQTARRECYRRGWVKSHHLPCKVVSVGNLAVGGTGKTPMTAYLARAIQDMGQQVVVIKRGYKGRRGSAPGVVSDGRQILMDSLQSGDEAQMLARQLSTVPVMIGADRYRTGIDAVSRFQPDVIVLDDGFQHIRLQRDLDLVLLDCAAPLGNGHLLPRGLLRESVPALEAADAIIFTRATQASAADKCFSRHIPADLPVYKSSHKPYHCMQNRGENLPAGAEVRFHDFRRLQSARVTVFSGIARNDDFLRVVTEHGAELASTNTFPDHHPYTRYDLERIAESALETGSDLLVTTEKDFVRLPPEFEWPSDLLVVGVDIDFGEEDKAFREFLQDRLR